MSNTLPNKRSIISVRALLVAVVLVLFLLGIFAVASVLARASTPVGPVVRDGVTRVTVHTEAS